MRGKVYNLFRNNLESVYSRWLYCEQTTKQINLEGMNLKKVMKKKWIVLALALTIVVAGAVSLTAFGADEQGTISESQMQKKQPICTINQYCLKRGVHHTEQNRSAAPSTTPAAGTSTASTYGNCQYPDCDGTHANHQNYGYHSNGQNHHGSSHGGGHGWHE